MVSFAVCSHGTLYFSYAVDAVPQKKVNKPSTSDTVVKFSTSSGEYASPLSIHKSSSDDDEQFFFSKESEQKKFFPVRPNESFEDEPETVK